LYHLQRSKMMKKYIVLALVFVACNAWNGILLDNAAGNTQLVLPNSMPHTLSGVNFGLPHLDRAVAVTHPTGSLYFTGGLDGSSASTQVTRFDPMTNTSTPATSMSTGHRDHGATVVGNTIIVCGGK
jgi:hypothetical protein